MHRRADRINKSLVRIGRKIHHHLRPRSHRGRHLNIQHHLAIRARSGAGSVLSLIDRDRRDPRRLLAQPLEVSSKIRRPVPAAPAR